MRFALHALVSAQSHCVNVSCCGKGFHPLNKDITEEDVHVHLLETVKPISISSPVRPNDLKNVGQGHQ